MRARGLEEVALARFTMSFCLFWLLRILFSEVHVFSSAFLLRSKLFSVLGVQAEMITLSSIVSSRLVSVLR